MSNHPGDEIFGGSEKFLQTQADEANRFSSRVFPGIEERREEGQRFLLKQPEPLSIVINPDSVLDTVRAIAGLKIKKAHGHGYGAKTREPLFPQLADDPFRHAVEPLRDNRRASSILLESFLFSQRFSRPLVRHHRIIDAARLFKEPLSPLAKPLG